jgi:peroxiredoxin Q/BCP
VALFAASVDDPETNRRFAESLLLGYPILSDPDKQVARAYGVLLRGIGLASRVTFYIGTDGRILHVDRSVDAKTAGRAVLDRLRALGVKRRP